MAQYTITNEQADIDFCVDQYETARILQNCKNLLMCHMGQVPYDRKRGFDNDLLSLPIEELNSLIIREMDRVLTWEPGAQVVSAIATIDENHETRITVVVQIEE